MKHSVKITISLIFLFFLSQIIGLHIISERYNINETAETNTTVVAQGDPVHQILGPPPKIGNTAKERISIIFQFTLAILVGTAIILLFAKFKLFKLWKLWFSFGVVIALFSALVTYVKILLSLFEINSFVLNIILTLIISIILVILKTYSKNIFVHNFTEIFIYGGIASILVSFFDIISISGLLVAISVYDMIAVWKSKHMIKLAEFQSKAKVFGGLFIPYNNKVGITQITENYSIKQKNTTKRLNEDNLKQNNSNKEKVAILGGGDIAFPLLFAGVLLLRTASIEKSLIITIFSTLSLSLLFLFSKKGKFYPAMPFITAGCFLGFITGFLI